MKQRGHWIGYDGVTDRTETTHVSEKVNFAENLNSFSDLWSPRTVTEFNGHDVIVVKVLGEFVWHKHDDTDDDFLVLQGEIDIQMRDLTITLGPGEMFVVPKNIEHRPIARKEAHMLLIDPIGTPNTGDEETATMGKLA